MCSLRAVRAKAGEKCLSGCEVGAAGSSGLESRELVLSMVAQRLCPTSQDLCKSLQFQILQPRRFLLLGAKQSPLLKLLWRGGNGKIKKDNI